MPGKDKMLRKNGHEQTSNEIIDEKSKHIQKSSKISLIFEQPHNSVDQKVTWYDHHFHK